jgi:hypothetical protein
MSYTTIEIYCDDEKYHPGKVCTVRRFARTGPGEWVPLDWLVPEAKQNLWLGPDADVPLDVATNRNLRKELVPPFTVRDWFKLQCYRCYRRGRYRRRGEYVLEVRDATLSEILESVDAETVKLGDLAARVRGSAGT